MSILTSKEPLITAQEVRVLLGVTPNTLSRYMRRGILGRDKQLHILESIKVRGRIYSSREAVTRFIEATSKLPAYREDRVAKKSTPSHDEAMAFLGHEK